jgi:agmatine deiminase
MQQITPKSLGYYFPSEWHPHRATWLSFPHKEASWPGKIETIFPAYFQFIRAIAQAEKVCINVLDLAMETFIRDNLAALGVNMQQIELYQHPTNDAWCRDHGPAFLLNKDAQAAKTIVKWEYNAWGNKYEHDLDNQIPYLIAEKTGCEVFRPGIVMEGGAVDFNGKGTVLTTEACLLNPNRNPHLTKQEIESYLSHYYGVEQVLWLADGIIGDDTDGHVDDLTRFVSEDTVVTVVEHDPQDENYAILQENLALLKQMRLLNGKQLNVVELPMPEPVIYEDQRLPASYANFYVCNAGVIVPTFGCKQDQQAVDILAQCFRDRPVIGIDSVDIIWGLGSFHCLSQQEPEAIV